MPKHVIIATWKNVTFAGGISQAMRTVSVFIFSGVATL